MAALPDSISLMIEHGQQPEDQAVRPPPRELRLDMLELEAAFESLSVVHKGDLCEPYASFLDLRDGHVITQQGEVDIEHSYEDKDLLPLPDSLFECLHYGAIGEFVHCLPDEPIRKQLSTAIRGKGAFRRFKDIVFDGENQEMEYRWNWFQTRLEPSLIVEPPLELWPEIKIRSDIPDDVRAELVIKPMPAGMTKHRPESQGKPKCGDASHDPS